MNDNHTGYLKTHNTSLETYAAVLLIILLILRLIRFSDQLAMLCITLYLYIFHLLNLKKMI